MKNQYTPVDPFNLISDIDEQQDQVNNCIQTAITTQNQQAKDYLTALLALLTNHISVVFENLTKAMKNGRLDTKSIRSILTQNAKSTIIDSLMQMYQRAIYYNLGSVVRPHPSSAENQINAIARLKTLLERQFDGFSDQCHDHLKTHKEKRLQTLSMYVKSICSLPKVATFFKLICSHLLP